MGIPVLMQVVVGTTSMPLSKIAALGPGSLVTLDQVLGAPVTVLVNGKPVASGELFVHDSDDGRLGIKIASVSGQKSER